jgi:hypothetical protein
MKIGTKSLLFGVHQVFIHPLWVALAWWKLYGFPWDPRLWVAFIVHDWGYWGCSEMDGPNGGDEHPLLGARICHFLFDSIRPINEEFRQYYVWYEFPFARGSKWFKFVLFHSRFLAKASNEQPSKLCMADKLSLGLEPWWLYLPRAWVSGELKEYMKSAQPEGKHGHMNCTNVSAITWYKSVQEYLIKYAFEHKDGKIDTVTQINRSDQV